MCKQRPLLNRSLLHRTVQEFNCTVNKTWKQPSMGIENGRVYVRISRNNNFERLHLLLSKVLGKKQAKHLSSIKMAWKPGWFYRTAYSIANIIFPCLSRGCLTQSDVLTSKQMILRAEIYFADYAGSNVTWVNGNYTLSTKRNYKEFPIFLSCF